MLLFLFIIKYETKEDSIFNLRKADLILKNTENRLNMKLSTKY